MNGCKNGVITLIDLIALTRQVMKDRAYDLGFESVEAMQEAQFAADRYFYEGDEMAGLALQSIRRGLGKVIAARKAAQTKAERDAERREIALRVARRFRLSEPDATVAHIARRTHAELIRMGEKPLAIATLEARIVPPASR